MVHYRPNSLRIDYKAVLKGKYARLLVGQVKELNAKDNSRKVACYKLAQDPVLLGFWNKRRHFRAMDEKDECGVGDIVLISQLPRPKGHLITHKVEQTLFKNGAIIDPITGRLCHGTDYAEDVANPQLQKYLESKKGEESEV